MPEKSFLDTVAINLRDSRESLLTGDPHLIAHGYAQSAFMFSGFGAPWIGNVLLRRSGQIQSKLNDPGVRGAFLSSEGIARYWGGDLKGAQSSLEQALPLLSRSGSIYTQMVSAHMLRHVHAYMSSATAEERAAREVLRLAHATGNVQCTCWGWYDLASALARRGASHEAMSHMQRSFGGLTNERFHMTEAIRASTYGYVLLQASQNGTARQAALEGWALVMKCPVDVTMFSLPVLIESIVGPTWTSRVPPSDAAVLRRLLRRAVFVHFSYPNHQPHLQRAAGRAFGSLGKHGKAIRKFEKAIKVAKKKGMDYQRARSLLDLAAVKEEGRRENRAEAIELLKKMESVIPHAERWLLGDQCDEAVVAPEFDLEAWERENGSVRVERPNNVLA